MKSWIRSIFLFGMMVVLPDALSAQTSADCKGLHSGTFTYGNEKFVVRVKIKGDHHTEFHSGGAYKIKSSIEWISDCEYETTMIECTVPDFPFQPGAKMRVQITGVSGNLYYYTATVGEETFTGVFTKIK